MDDIGQARRKVWSYAGVSPAEAIAALAPSIDVLTLAFANLAAQFETSQVLFAELSAAFDELDARERREHRPVSGWVTFGRPVRGVVSFTATPHH